MGDEPRACKGSAVERPEWADFPSCGSGATGWDGSYKNGYVLLRQRARFEAQQIAIWREGRRDFRVRMPGVSMVAHARRPLRTPPGPDLGPGGSAGLVRRPG